LICNISSGRLQSPGYSGNTMDTSDCMTRPLWQTDWLLNKNEHTRVTCDVNTTCVLFTRYSVETVVFPPDDEFVKFDGDGCSSYYLLP